MAKAILKDILLAGIAIAAQVGMNALNKKENDWVFIIVIGLALGVADFFLSYLKGKLEAVNYTIPGITKGTIGKASTFKKPDYSKKKQKK